MNEELYVGTWIDTLWPIVFVAIGTILLYVFRKQIRASETLYKYIPMVLFTILVILEYELIWKPLVGMTESFQAFVAAIPMHLCSMSVVMIVLYYITKKELFFNIVILQGIIGAIVTFLFPDVGQSPAHFYYWKFFFSHTILFLLPMYYFIIDKKKVSRTSFIQAYIALHVFGVLALLINWYTDTNYMYISPDNTVNILSFLPVHEAIPFFGQWPAVLLFGEILAFVFYIVTYGILYQAQKHID